MVGNVSLCLCLWLGWWEISCHPGACATSPCWGWSSDCSVSALVRPERPLSWNVPALLLKTAALQRWNTSGISSCSFGLLCNSTPLNWDFTFLLITWEGFLLLGLPGAVPGAVLVPALLQSNQGCDLCVCLPPPVITERLLGGRTWIRAEFHRSCSLHPGNSCLAASRCSSNWCLAAWRL